MRALDFWFRARILRLPASFSAISMRTEKHLGDDLDRLAHIKTTSNSSATSDTREATSFIKLFLSGEALTVGIGAPLS
jgi:hypothetical protein